MPDPERAQYWLFIFAAAYQRRFWLSVTKTKLLNCLFLSLIQIFTDPSCVLKQTLPTLLHGVGGGFEIIDQSLLGLLAKIK